MNYDKKVTASKIFIIIMIILSIIVTGFSLGICIWLWTVEPLYYLIPSIFTELASATGFYYWKSKNENKTKMILSFAEEMEKLDNLTDEQVRVIESFANNT